MYLTSSSFQHLIKIEKSFKANLREIGQRRNESIENNAVIAKITQHDLIIMQMMQRLRNLAN